MSKKPTGNPSTKPALKPLSRPYQKCGKCGKKVRGSQHDCKNGK